MTKKDNTRFVRMALNLGMIDLGKFNKVMDLWEEEPTRDSGQILLDQNFISKEQYQEILSMFSNKSKEIKNFDVSQTGFLLSKKDKRFVEKDKLPLQPKGEEEIVYNDNFTLRGILGEGGIGCVFLCYDKNINREVAIKELALELKEEDKKRVFTRFVREAKITGQLEHPGIVPVYELNAKDDGTIYYVMKHVKGKTLYKAINDARADSPEEFFSNRIKLFDNLIDVCEAMSYAHSRNVIHRDLKPGNIILGEFGETIILDWGTAKRLGIDEDESNEPAKAVSAPEVDADLTQHGELLGTPSYMSPEQINSRFGDVDERSDVFALGTILFILLTGEKPYKGLPNDIMDLIASDNPSPAPRSRGKFIPPELDAICQKAMSKRKDDRFNNASELLKELKAYRDGRLISVYAYSKKELFKRFVKRNKVMIIATAAVILSIIVGAGFAVNFAIDANEAKKRTERALVDVSEFSESALSLSRNSVRELDYGFDMLISGMKEIAQGYSRLDLTDEKEMEQKLKELKEEAPGIEAWAVIVKPGTITAVYPPLGGKSVITPQEYDSIISGFKEGKDFVSDVATVEQGIHVILIHAPIYKRRAIVGLLTAIIMPDTAIPEALSFKPKESDYQVWCMDKDGQIIYDEDPAQIGKDLFSDEMYAKYPELLKFGERMMKDPWGVGYYKFIDVKTEREVYKIAAWDTFSPIEKTNWKIVITYPYTTE